MTVEVIAHPASNSPVATGAVGVSVVGMHAGPNPNRRVSLTDQPEARWQQIAREEFKDFLSRAFLTNAARKIIVGHGSPTSRSTYALHRTMPSSSR
jgi:hypothetical protein